MPTSDELPASVTTQPSGDVDPWFAAVQLRLASAAPSLRAWVMKHLEEAARTAKAERLAA